MEVVTVQQRTSLASNSSLLAMLGLIAIPAAVELGLAVAPSTRTYVIYGAIALALLWLANDFRSTRTVLFSATVLVAALVCLHLVPWNARKSFLKQFQQVKPDMHVRQVDALLRGYSFGEGGATNGIVERRYAHSPLGRFDSDWGIVRFRDEHVVDSTFLPD